MAHGFNTNTIQITGFMPIPEPTSALMLLSGTGLLLGLRRKRRTAA
jgi:hypothetical protein